MNLSGLLASLFLWFGPCAPIQAQTPDTNAPVRARTALARLDVSLAPLRRGAYRIQDRRPIAEILSSFRVQSAALRPGNNDAARIAAWGRLERAAIDAVHEEEDFWRSLPESRGQEPLPEVTADALKRRAAELTAAFSELFPEHALPPAPADGTPTPTRQPPARAVPDRAARAVSGGGGAAADARLFYDGGATAPNGDAAANQAAAGGLVGGPAAPHAAFTGPARTHPSDLALGPVPAPEAITAETTPREGVLNFVTPSAQSALRSAAESAPVPGDAVVSAFGRPADAVETTAASPEAACREASDGGTIAGLCGSRLTAWSAPLAAGLLDAVKEQFGSVSGVASLLAFTAVGLLLSALSGGVGLLVALIKAVCGIAVLWTVMRMLNRVAAALKEFLSTREDEPRHWRALREIGKVGGEMIILMMMAFVGYKIGEKPAVKDAVTSMTAAIQGQMSRLGLRPTPPPAQLASALAAPSAPAGNMGAAGNRSNLRPPDPPPSGVAAGVRPATKIPAPPSARSVQIAEIQFPRPQLQHEFRHAADFGVSGTSSNRTLLQFQEAILKHLESVPRGVPGKYRQTVDVVHFTDPRSGLNVMLRPDGEFLGAWKLNEIQLQNVLTRASL